jgi:hypothetical protein
MRADAAQAVPTFQLAGIRHYLDELSHGTLAVGAPTNHIQEVTGKPPESFETIARRYMASPYLIVPGLRVGTKLQALMFMGKMMLTRVPDLDRWERERGHPLLKEPVPSFESQEWRAAAEHQTILLHEPAETG